MIRGSIIAVLGLTIAFGGAALAQQASGEATESETSADVAAPASDETGVKGVYSLKSMMGISTGQSATKDAEASEESKPSAAEEAGGQPASEWSRRARHLVHYCRISPAC